MYALAEMQAVTFKKCNNLMVNNLNFEKAQRKHVSFENCTNVKAFDIRVNAPEGSPNTDGIHVTETKNIHISNSLIRTGIYMFYHSKLMIMD